MPHRCPTRGTLPVRAFYTRTVRPGLFPAAVEFVAWHARIGRLGTADWIIIIAYFVTGGLAVRAALVRSGPSEVFPWALTAASTLVLGLNKLLNTEGWILDSLRAQARAAGWYGHRRGYQAIVIALVAMAGLSVTMLVVRRIRGVTREGQLAVLTLGLLLVFVAIRAISLHQVDRLLNEGEIHLRSVIEFIGICILAGCCIRRSRHHRGRQVAASEFG
jgi:hypothetical protein